jgi:DNA-binding transcriptional LysR family regulator
MNERQLQSFVTAAKEGSLSRAAKRSFISVQALSAQIRLLETSLQVKLFDRSAKGLKLTPEGEIFYKAAKSILQTGEQAKKEIEAYKSRLLRIALPKDQQPEFVLRACSKFNALNTGCRIDLLSIPYSEQLAALQAGQCDLAIMAKPNPEDRANLTYYSLGQDTYAFAMNAANPLSQKDCLTLADLENAEILCGFYPFLEQPFDTGLKESKAHLTFLRQEYSDAVKNKMLFEKGLLVIHSKWSNAYSSVLQVVPSNIDAGEIGMVTALHPRKEAVQFLELLEEELHLND